MKVVFLILLGIFHTDAGPTPSTVVIPLPGSTIEDCETKAAEITAKATGDDKVLLFGHACASVEATAVSHA